MDVKKLTFNSTVFPEALRTIPAPPQEIYVASNNLADLLNRPCLTVVGSRRVTPYGRAVTTQLVSDLARAGVVIVSGLAIGVDAIAHRAALEAGGATIAVLPASLHHIYPQNHQQLARQIVKQGGALLSEYAADAVVYKSNFIARNRLTAGLSQAILITEAAKKSGTLHTARFALEQGKDVLAVPGNITNPNSAGCNNLIKTGAMPVTGVEDIFHVLGLKPATATSEIPKGSTEEEEVIIRLIARGENDGAALLLFSNLTVPVFNQTLTMLELSGKIRSLGANRWSF